MDKVRQNKIGFTLVEIIVAISIFMIMMVSVLQIFGISTQLTNKVDINRQVQENIKNLTETIAEDIRQNKIGGVKKNILGSYKNDSGENGVILKIGSGGFFNKYYLSLDDTTYSIISKNDIGKCQKLNNNCFLVKDDGTPTRLTNSFIAFENLEFKILGDKVKRLVIIFKVRPASKKGVRINLIKSNIINFQTTLSERFIQTN